MLVLSLLKVFSGSSAPFNDTGILFTGVKVIAMHDEGKAPSDPNTRISVVADYECRYPDVNERLDQLINLVVNRNNQDVTEAVWLSRRITQMLEGAYKEKGDFQLCKAFTNPKQRTVTDKNVSGTTYLLTAIGTNVKDRFNRDSYAIELALSTGTEAVDTHDKIYREFMRLSAADQPKVDVAKG